MIARIGRLFDRIGEWSDKAKAIVGAVGTFAGVVVAATADDVLGMDEIATVVTAAVALATAVYAVVWRTPNGPVPKARSSRR